MWTCSRCGAENTGKYCCSCGQGRPLQADSLRRAKIILAAVITTLLIAAFVVLIFLLRPGASPVPEVSEAPTPLPTAATAPTPAPTPTPTPSPEPTPRQGPGEADMQGCDRRVLIPDGDSWLEAYETRYVHASMGRAIILRWLPAMDYQMNGVNYLDLVWEEEEVTELARQNGFSLIRTQSGQIGWVPSDYLVSDYR